MERPSANAERASDMLRDHSLQSGRKPTAIAEVGELVNDGAGSRFLPGSR